MGTGLKLLMISFNMTGNSGHYGALGASFGRFNNEFPQTGKPSRHVFISLNVSPYHQMPACLP